MVVRVEQNRELFQEKLRLLKRLEEIDKVIEVNYRKVIRNTEQIRDEEDIKQNKKRNEARNMADEQVEQKVEKLSMADRYAKAQEMIKTEKSNSKIAKVLGCSTTYVYNVRMGKIKSKVTGK